jgi:ATP-dependent helicase/DNAse subunit B
MEMNKGTIFIAPLGARNKKSAIFDEILSHCPDGDYSSVLYITPAIFSLREARRQFFTYLKSTRKKKVYIPFQSFTIKNLCTNIYETYGREEIVSDQIEPMILCEVLGEKNMGYAHLLSELLSKIRHFILDKGLSQVKEDIKSLIFEEKTLGRAIRAIEILELYERELKEKGLIDFEYAIKESISLIKRYINQNSGEDKSFIKTEILVLDGFFDPTPLELEVIKALIERVDKTYVLVEENAEFLRFFESFDEGFEKRRLKLHHHRESVRYYSYPSMEDEIEGIAKRIKALLLEGTRPHEITVSFPLLQKYLPMLKRVFKKYGIPISIAEYELYNIKPIIALLDMITSIEEDYPRIEFLSFLTSVHFPNIPEVIKQWAGSFSNKAGIVKGKHSWLSIKERLFNSIEDEISEDEKKTIEEFQRQLKKVINTLERLKDEKSLSSFVDELEAILERFGFWDSLQNHYPNKDEIISKIEGVFSKLRYFSALYNSNGFRIEEAGLYLRHLLRGLKGGSEDLDGVRVVPFELAAGLECKAMFFGGMIEGDLPSKPDIDPILPEKVKKNLGLPFLEYYLDRQKRYFKRLLNASSDEPYFSYPVADGDNIFLPSPFLDWGLSLSPPEINISTEEEILIREGAFKQRDFSEILWDGEPIRDKDIKEFLMQKLNPQVFIRVTDIDAYRQCPLRFYIEKLLGLEVERPPRFEVEARLWGRLVHKTMEYLFRQRDIEIEDMDKRLFQGLELSLRQFPIGDFWSKIAREIFQRLLPLIKEQERDIRMQGFSPYKVEENIMAEINGLRLKGKIDRVDKKFQIPNSKFQTQNTVRLLDYKTGSIDKDSLQLPLYACMWQKENTEIVERVGFYSLKDGAIEWYPKRLKMDEFIQSALQSAEEIVQKMRKGEFKPIPSKEDECRYCYHSALCKGSK